MKPYSAEYQRILKWIFAACLIAVSFVFFSGNRVSEPLAFKIVIQNSSLLPEKADWPLIYGNLKHMFFCLFIFAFFFCVGNIILRFCFGMKDIDGKTALYSIGVGSGVFSAAIMLTAFFFRATHFVLTCYFWFLTVFSAVYIICLIRRTKKTGVRKVTGDFPYVMAILLLSALLLNLFSAALPPFEYDSLEYHLAGPKEILRNGRYAYFDNNMYMNIPSNISMVYLFIQGVARDSGKFVNYAYGLLILGAIYAFVADKAGKNCALLAAASFYITGLLTKELMYAHIEISAAFFTVLAFMCIWEYLSGKKIPYLVLCGIFAGFALGSKYTSVLTLILPVLSVLLVFENGGKKIGSPLIFVFTVLLVFSPWILKNIMAAKNPFYPIFQDIFGGAGGWTPEISRRFAVSHYGSAGSAIDNIKSLADFSINDYFGTPLLLLFPLFCLFSLKNPFAKIGGVWIITGILSWAVFSKGYIRFLIPSFPIIFISGALCFPDLPAGITCKKLTKAVITFMLFFNFLSCAMLFAEGRYLKVFASQCDREDFLKKANNHYAAVMHLNKYASADTKVLFLGEARTYYAEFIPLYNTVFNNSILSGTGNDIFDRRYYLDNNIGYILVNIPELERMMKTYKYTPVNDMNGYLKWLKTTFPRFYEDRSGIIIYKI
ncbi:MAG: glycosyltransferase family 39 protein [bacterium]|nr:glycosyltransferase family 39 protein [bacterium]